MGTDPNEPPPQKRPRTTASPTEQAEEAGSQADDDFSIVSVTVAQEGLLDIEITAAEKTSTGWEQALGSKDDNGDDVVYCIVTRINNEQGVGALSGFRRGDIIVEETESSVQVIPFERSRAHLLGKRPFSVKVARKRSQSEIQVRSTQRADVGSAPLPASSSTTVPSANASYNVGRFFKASIGIDMDSSERTTTDDAPGDVLTDATDGQHYSLTDHEHRESNQPLSTTSNSQKRPISFDNSWGLMFDGLVEFQKKEGHLSVPNNYLHDGKNLSNWIGHQRAFYRNTRVGKKPFMPEERIKLLESINFDFDPKGVNDKTLNTAVIRIFENEPSYGAMVDEIQDVEDRYGIEKRFMAWLDREIYRAEENEFMKKLDEEITLAEEKERQEATGGLHSSCSVEARGFGVGTTERKAYAMEEASFLYKINREIETAKDTGRPKISDQLSGDDKRCSAEPAWETATFEARAPRQGIVGSDTVCRRRRFLPSFQPLPGQNTPLWKFADIVETLKRIKGVHGSVVVREVAGDPSTLCLEYVGTKPGIGQIDAVITGLLDRRCRKVNYVTLASLGKKLPKVLLDASKPLGTRLSESDSGLLVKLAKGKESQLGNSIGVKTLSSGAAILSVDGEKCRSIDSFKQVLARVQRSGRPLCMQLSVGISLETSARGPAPPGLKRTTSESMDNVSLNSETGNREANIKIASFAHLRKKFKESVEIEYKESEISTAYILGRMWDQHKRRFGFHCNDSCRCVFRLKDLCSSVVTEKLRASSGDWRNPLNLKPSSFPVGFVSSYAETFLPQLEKRYADEPPSFLLKRLVMMWRQHAAACQNDCSCFVMKENEEIEKPSSVSSSLPSSAIPRKRLPTVTQESLIRSTTGIPASAIPRHHTNAPNNKTQSAKTINSCEHPEYSVEFVSGDPLGFFCITESSSDGQSTCKISSIAPLGQARNKDQRIQNGSIVVAAGIKGCRKDISDHVQLKDAYESAQNSKSDITLWFVNSAVSKTSIAQADRQTFQLWTSAGKWKGNCSNGWHGGAALVTEDRVSVPIAKTHQLSAPENSNALFSDTQDWVLVESKRPLLKGGTIRSILKGGLDHVASKLEKTGVTFADDSKQEYRKFDTEQSSIMFWMKKSTNAPTEVVDRKPTKNDLFEATQTKTFLETIRLLENGAASAIDCEDDLQMMLKQCVKPALEAINSQVQAQPRDQALLVKQRDLLLKSKLLKIYMEFEHAVRSSKALKKWTKFELYINGAELSYGSAISEGELIVEQRINIGQHDESHLRLSSIPIARHVKLRNAKLHSMKVNLTLEPRTCEIRLSHRSSTETRTLGSVILTTSDLHDIWSHNTTGTGKWHLCKCGIVPSFKSPLKSGTLAVSIRKGEMDFEILRKKRDSATQTFKTALTWMKRFNLEDLTEYERRECPLSANVRIANQSILHAAVLLEEPELVRDLITLLNDSGTHRKTVASARALAHSMAEGEECIVGSDKSTKDHSAPTLALQTGHRHSQERRKRLASIINILKQHIHSNESTNSLSLSCEVTESDAADGSPNLNQSALRDVPPTTKKVIHNGPTTATARLPVSAATHTGKASTVPVEVDLESWVLPQKSRKFCCHFQYSKRGCLNSLTKCPFVHVHLPWGSSELERLWLKCKHLFKIDFRKAVDPHSEYLEQRSVDKRKTWYTAKYHSQTARRNDVSHGLHIIFAEGGPSQLNRQGFSWYNTRRDAQDALERTVFVTFWATHRGIKPDSGNIRSDLGKLLFDLASNDKSAGNR